MKLQIVRRIVQASICVVLVALPLLSLYAHYRAARTVDDSQLMSGFQGAAVTQALHPYIDRLSDPSCRGCHGSGRRRAGP